MSGKREFGDYQTPSSFAGRVCDYLRLKKGIHPTIVIEPTCGKGNFLESSLVFNADRYFGIEINTEYCEYCRKRMKDKRVSIINHDFFSFELKKLIGNTSNVLVLGNPPWVTNSELSSLESGNLPVKVNFKGMNGMDAMTGSSNFDICEYMILQMINELRGTDAVIAMLCKISVARNVFKELKRGNVNFKYCDVVEFDAARIFGISARACILTVKLSETYSTADACNVYSFEGNQNPEYSFGYVSGRFFSNIQAFSYDFDGECCFEWRQGVKHDCSKIMELTKEQGIFYNGKKEKVDIEDHYLFPLVKSSMFKRPVIDDFSKYVLVTQKKIRQDTACIEQSAPKTWKYLNDNIEFFRNRKSSIYRGAPQFSMFGIGGYSYARYKVGVSGFYKKPVFSVLYSIDGKPVMTDDTSYFICFDSYDMAYVAMLLLNSEPVQKFLMSIAFLDAKRPYTKKVLERLSFEKMVTVISYEELQRTENLLALKQCVTEQMYFNFRRLPALCENKQMAFA